MEIKKIKIEKYNFFKQTRKIWIMIRNKSRRGENKNIKKEKKKKGI
jgi:hypothetical protein